MDSVDRVGWGMYWTGKEKDKQINELISIIHKLGGEEELSSWRARVIQRAQDKEDRKVKRQLKSLKIK